MGNLDIKISPQPTQAALRSQRAYPVNLAINANSQFVWQAGRFNEDEEGAILMELAGKHAEVRLYPKAMTTRVTTLEEDLIRMNLMQGMQELGMLAGSGILLNGSNHVKPFNVAMTVPRFLEQRMQHVVPATAENLASGFPDFFNDDPVTQRLREELAFSIRNLSTPPDAGLVMETPGIRAFSAPQIDLMVNSFSEQQQHLTEMRIMDISTALQIAIQTVYSSQSGRGTENGRSTMLLTNKQTKRGKRIAVSNIPNSLISLREVSDENDAAYYLQQLDPRKGRSKQKTTAAISTTAVFRQLA